MVLAFPGNNSNLISETSIRSHIHSYRNPPKWVGLTWLTYAKHLVRIKMKHQGHYTYRKGDWITDGPSLFLYTAIQTLVIILPLGVCLPCEKDTICHKWYFHCKNKHWQYTDGQNRYMKRNLFCKALFSNFTECSPFVKMGPVAKE